jgi:hypothetical protein
MPDPKPWNFLLAVRHLLCVLFVRDRSWFYSSLAEVFSDRNAKFHLRCSHCGWQTSTTAGQIQSAIAIDQKSTGEPLAADTN